MPDGQQTPGSDEPAAGAGSGGPAADDAGADPAGQAGPGDTAPLPAAGERGAGETAPLPAAEVPGPDETAPLPEAARPDETAPLPAAGERALDETARIPAEGAEPAETAALPSAGTWYARAEVPRPGAPADYGYADQRYAPGPDEGGRWWLPIVIAVVALLLLGVLGYGIWLISSANEGSESPAPALTTSAPSRRTPTTPPARTTKPPVTATAPASVPVPRVIGLSAADARAALDSVGLASRLAFRPSDTAPAGTVIAAEPPPGTQVPPGTEITLVIASAPRTTPPTEASPTSPPATPNG
jgi:hypothetical protein